MGGGAKGAIGSQGKGRPIRRQSKVADTFTVRGGETRKRKEHTNKVKYGQYKIGGRHRTFRMGPIPEREIRENPN